MDWLTSGVLTRFPKPRIALIMFETGYPHGDATFPHSRDTGRPPRFAAQ